METEQGTERIYLSPPRLGGNERQYLEEAIASNWIAPLGPFVDRFEEMLTEITGARYCVALSSGTAGLHLGLLALGIEQGDHILCSDLTFIASANAIRYSGAIPVFVESDPATWNISPRSVEEAIERLRKKGISPRALIPTHLYGVPCPMDEILEICNRHRIVVLEDAAEALGSTLNGKHAGTFGVAGVLSFNGNKIVTTSGGGAVITDNKEIADKVRHLATQARLPSLRYLHDAVGYNYRLSNLLAAVGCAQLEELEQRVEERRVLAERYADATGWELQSEPEGARSNRWLASLRAPNRAARDVALEQLTRSNIEARPCWTPMTRQPICDDGTRFPVSEQLDRSGICLPSGIAPDSPEWDRVIAALQKH